MPKMAAERRLGALLCLLLFVTPLTMFKLDTSPGSLPHLGGLTQSAAPGSLSVRERLRVLLVGRIGVTPSSTPPGEQGSANAGAGAGGVELEAVAPNVARAPIPPEAC